MTLVRSGSRSSSSTSKPASRRIFGDVLLGRPLVAGRVDRVEANELGEQLDGLASKRARSRPFRSIPSIQARVARRRRRGILVGDGGSSVRSSRRKPEATRDVPAADAPSAVRMRPRSLEELVGQGHLLADGSALRTAVETREPHSAILYGPPGTGKTTLARIVAQTSDAAFEEESAVNAGKAQVTAVIERARERRKSGRRTVLFLDEIHRFNKAQQDALLPAVEEGLVTLIGATTENPYFEVNSALLSRCQIYELRELSAGRRRGAPAPRALRSRARHRGSARDRRRRARAPRPPLRRRCPRSAGRARARGRDGARQRRADRPRDGRGRAPAQGDRLRPPGRQALRLRLGA